MSKEVEKGGRKMITGATEVSSTWPVGQVAQRNEITDTPGTAMPQVGQVEEAKAVVVEISKKAQEGAVEGIGESKTPPEGVRGRALKAYTAPLIERKDTT